jgi:hypothetical protein
MYSRSVCLGVKPHLGPKTRFLLLSHSWRFADVGHPLWWMMGLLFTIAVGPDQRNHSWVWVPWDSWSYFTVSDSRHLQPGGPGPRVYIPQEQGGPVIPPCTGFPFCHLQLSRATVEVFKTHLHAGNWLDCRLKVKSHSYFITGSLPPVSSSWCQAPWDSQPEGFFPTEPLR